MSWFSRARTFDLLWAMPLIFFYILAAVKLGLGVMVGFKALRTDHFLLHSASLLAQSLTLIFICLQVVFFCVRRLPVAKAESMLARFVAVISSNFLIMIIVLPHADSSATRDLISSSLQAAGLAVAIYVLSILGRSFSILPQARGLVTHGPYRFIRHPLYLAETIAQLGIMLQYIQPWAFLIMGSSFVLLLIRMNYEEQVLLKHYPEYAKYIGNAARILPGIY